MVQFHVLSDLDLVDVGGGDAQVDHESTLAHDLDLWLRGARGRRVCPTWRPRPEGLRRWSRCRAGTTSVRIRWTIRSPWCRRRQEPELLPDGQVDGRHEPVDTCHELSAVERSRSAASTASCAVVTAASAASTCSSLGIGVLRIVQVGLCIGELRLCIGHGGLELCGVERGEHLPSGDRVASGDVDRGDRASGVNARSSVSAAATVPSADTTSPKVPVDTSTTCGSATAESVVVLGPDEQPPGDARTAIAATTTSASQSCGATAGPPDGGSGRPVPSADVVGGAAVVDMRGSAATDAQSTPKSRWEFTESRPGF